MPATDADLEKIFQNLHRSTYRHFERSTSIQYLLPELIPEVRYEAADLIDLHVPDPKHLPSRTKKIRKLLQRKRKVLHTLNEVADRLTAIRCKIYESKRGKVERFRHKRKVNSKLDESSQTPISIIEDSPLSYSIVDGNEYLADTSRVHSTVLIIESGLRQDQCHINLLVS